MIDIKAISGVNKVKQRVKPLATPTSHVSTGSSAGCSTSDTVPGIAVKDGTSVWAPATKWET